MRLSRELLGTELESGDLHSLGLGWIGVLPSILAILLACSDNGLLSHFHTSKKLYFGLVQSLS